MGDRPFKVLLVEDNPGDARLVREFLAEAARHQVELECVETLSAAVKRLEAGGIDAVLLDLGLPDSRGLDTVVRLHAEVPEVPIVVLTGLEDEGLGVRSVQAGAQDYLVKGQVPGQLLARGLRYAIERKRSEVALRESEERFRVLVETARDGIITIGADRRVRLFNRAAERIFGYSAEEIVGESLDVLMPPEYRDWHAAAIRRYLETGQSTILGRTVEVNGLRKGGEVVPLELSLSEARVEGESTFTGIVRDITERRRTEEALRQSEKLATMGELLAGVAHELNNPLSVLMGRAILLKQMAGSGSLAGQAEKIAEAGTRCARIVRNFLALARQYPPELQPAGLNQIVEEVVELLAYPLRVDDVEVSLDLDPAIPGLWADSHQLHQVLVNLITNAHHAMRKTPPPRRLTVSTRLAPDRARVALRVADTGPGIPREIHRRIFEPFFTTKPPGQGTGLGLSLCQGIVEGHGGTIRLEGRPGPGAVFVVELPAVAPPTVMRDTPAAAPIAADQGKAILVVDDEPEVAGVLAEMLSLDGHEAETAANGIEALAKLREGTYDLILCDMKMPEMDGPGFYRELERRHPALLERIIFVTGGALSPEIREFLEQTRVPTLSKPFTPDSIRLAIQRVL